MTTVFRDIKGVLLDDFLEHGKVNNANIHCDTLRKVEKEVLLNEIISWNHPMIV